MSAARVRRQPAREGMTLVEAALLVCIAGVLLAVMIPAFARALRTSKIAEASEELASMHRAAASYYAARHGERRDRLVRCLPAQAGPAPATPSEDPVEVDFAAESTPGHATWSALGFAPARPLRYRYSFLPVKDGCDLGAEGWRPAVTVRAEGDLDSDGKLSAFERRAVARPDGELRPLGVLRVVARTE